MNNVRSGRWWLVLWLLLVVAVALVLRGWVRDVAAVWAVYMAWLVRLGIESVPGVVFWALFFVASLVIVLRSLSREQRPRLRQTQSEGPLPSPLEAELRVVELATESDYGQWRLAQRLTQLLTEAIAHDMRIGSEEARRLLRSGALALPEDVKAYLELGHGSTPTRMDGLVTWLRERLARGRGRRAIGEGAERTLRLLEALLEVGRGK